jgi:hypothetical protein
MDIVSNIAEFILLFGVLIATLLIMAFAVHRKVKKQGKKKLSK